MRMKKTVRALLVAAPIVCAWISLVRYPLWLIPLAIAMLFLAVMLYGNRRENLWMFVLSVPVLIPVCIRVMSGLAFILDYDSFFVNALLYAFAFYTILSILVLVLQYMTRLIWKKQRTW